MVLGVKFYGSPNIINMNKLYRKSNRTATQKLFSKNEKMAIMENVFAHVRPILYIKFGPPASGKGSIMDKVLAKDGISLQSLVTVDVDSTVQQSVQFQQEVSQAKEQYGDTTEQAKALQKIYFKYRPEADAISIDIVHEACKRRLNIARETTGQKLTTVDTIRQVRPFNYQVTIVYPLVPVQVLVDRAVKRNAETGQIAAPADMIEHMAHQAAENVVLLLAQADTLYIYDNSGTIGQEQIVIKVTTNPTTRQQTMWCNCQLKNVMAQKFTDTIQTMLAHFCKKCEE